jgi:hypothetical protein
MASNFKIGWLRLFGIHQHEQYSARHWAAINPSVICSLLDNHVASLEVHH